MRLLASALFAVLLLERRRPPAQPERFSLEARDVDLADVIRLLGARSGQNVVADGSVKQQRVTLRLKNVTFDEALATLLAAYALQTHRDGRVVIVGDAASMNRRFPDDATPGGTQTAVFALAHARPDDVAASLQNALAQGTVVVGDKRTGALVVTGSPSTVARARRLVAALDAPGLRHRRHDRDGVDPAPQPARQRRREDAAHRRTGEHAVRRRPPERGGRQRQHRAANHGPHAAARSRRAGPPGDDRGPRRRRAAGQRQHERRRAVRRRELRLGRARAVSVHADEELAGGERADRRADPARPRVDPRPAAHHHAQQPRSDAARRRAVPGRDGEPADGLPERADDRRRRAPAPHADDRRRRHDHGRPASRVQPDHRLQQQLPDRGEPQGRRDAARARRRDDRARRPVPRRRLGDGHEVPGPRRSSGAGRLLPQPPNVAQQGRGRLLHHPARPRRATRRSCASVSKHAGDEAPSCTPPFAPFEVPDRRAAARVGSRRDRGRVDRSRRHELARAIRGTIARHHARVVAAAAVIRRQPPLPKPRRHRTRRVARCARGAERSTGSDDAGARTRARRRARARRGWRSSSTTAASGPTPSAASSRCPPR